MRTIELWVGFWVVLLLPIVLIGVGKRRADSHRGSRDRRHDQDGVHFARGLGALAAMLPVVFAVLGFWPESVLYRMVSLVMLYIPILGALAGLGALGLYVLSGRGIERWTGSLASILAVGWLVLLVLAGWAAA